MSTGPMNLKTAIAHGESSQDPGDKDVPNHSPDPQEIGLPLRQTFLFQAFCKYSIGSTAVIRLKRRLPKALMGKSGRHHDRREYFGPPPAKA